MRRDILTPILVVGMTSVVVVARQPANVPVEGVTFEQAIERAITRNASLAQASARIRRAEAILQQVRASNLPTVDAILTTTTTDPVIRFGSAEITPRTQLFTGLALNVPILTPVIWAQRAQAADQVMVAERSRDDVRREIAVAAAHAYLRVIAERRVLELNERSRETAHAHYEYARQRFEGGLGSRLNQIRAQQVLSSDEVRVEEARLALRRAQEALGVLLASDQPVDASIEPAFEVPPESSDEAYLTERADTRLVRARETAAERVVRDSWRDYLPAVNGLFAPQHVTPTGLFRPTRSWTAQILFSVQLFEAGERRGLARERRAELDAIQAERLDVDRQARSEVRIARDAVRSTERALASARAASQEAAEVVKITDVAFRTGATTNIEVIDAQRQARDAETAAVIVEDAVRRARLELLVALGQFLR